MNKTTLGILVLSANILFALVGRGSMHQLIIIVLMIEFIALPAVVVAIIAFLFRRKWRSGSTIARLFSSVAFVVVSTLVSLWPGRMLLKYDIEGAKRHCEALVPKLEAYRLAHGSYPSSIEAIKDSPSAPLLLHNAEFYHSDGSEYTFSFGDPSGMLNGFAFEGNTKTWSKWD